MPAARLASRTATGSDSCAASAGSQRRQSGVAGAGSVEDVRRLGRKMLDAVLVDQRHAVVAARHHDRAEPVLVA